MRLRKTILTVAMLATAPALSAEQPIAVIAPLSGPSEILGKQVRIGAEAAARASGVMIFAEDDSCSAEGGKAAAEQAIKRQARVVVGFLCTESIEAALPLLKDAKIPVITIGVRASSLTDKRDKTGWPLFRLAPRADSEAAAVARALPRLWREEPFAIVDDGTIYGRELAEGFRAAAEQAQLKPVFVDTYRPDLDNQVALVGRLRRAGATHIFVGGSRRDVAIMARDAKQLGTDMTFAGGEVLRTDIGDVPLATGSLMVGLPEWAENADQQVGQAFNSQQIIPEGYVLPAYAAVQIAAAALKTNPGDVMAALQNTQFATVLGPVKFDPKGDLAENWYRVYRYDGSVFVQMERD